MSPEQITADPAAPAPSAPSTIDVNKHGSARLPAAAAEVDEEASTIIIAAGYTLTTPPRHVAAASNAGLGENQGTMSATGNTELPIEVPNVPGLGGLGVNAQEQAGVSVSTAAQIGSEHPNSNRNSSTNINYGRLQGLSPSIPCLRWYPTPRRAHCCRRGHLNRSLG